MQERPEGGRKKEAGPREGPLCRWVGMCRGEGKGGGAEDKVWTGQDGMRCRTRQLDWTSETV